ncbi:hypothetical protein FE236_00810 [Mariprofundus erugo]|uniref:Uncharacterized protein n=1 Tax=Mariprofundus erugo TaxID=2528639 RepID=A0A5R9GPA7_9PROT|nr:hypothetical protein [Mariprofundus erugo]TLS66253.1 hypothetical protein FEF65_10550 [Mariprofundus erugo]TLS78327.1 hypothetical protein FE236_00810 [Mariprofundus erugo]
MKCYQYVCALAMALMLSTQPSMADDNVPATLADMEQHAEQIVGALLARDEATSRALYLQLTREMNLLDRQALNNPADERRSRELLMAHSWMRVIAIETGDKSWIEAAVAANQLSGMIIQASHFPGLMQRDVAWLAYLAREMELLTLEDPVANADLLNLRLLTLESTWQRVGSELIKNFKNKPLLMEGDSLVAAMKASKSPAETVVLARKMLAFNGLVEKAL